VSRVLLAPSILSADFSRLGDQVQEAEAGGADWIHVDVMDGRFVPNITMGPQIAAAVRRSTSLPVDVHLMIEQPERHLEAFADAGVDVLTVHVETSPHLHRTVQRIRELGIKAGVTLNPATPLQMIEEILDDVDLVLIMSVNPGVGGQRYIASSTRRIAWVRAALERRGRSEVLIEVDGGIDAERAPEVVAAGATVLVAGSAVYNTRASVAENLSRLREAASRAEV
jgi:ribulose-phosphate 3-epimerase